MLHSLPYMMLIAQADFQVTAWSLYATPEACTSLDHIQHSRIRAFFQSRKKHYVLPDAIIPDRESVCRLCTHCIRHAHTHKQLGNWAAAMQFRMKYLPYESHFSLKMIRAASRVHSWDISVPPPDEFIYAILHLHMICIYVGRTHLALIQRLRKHITTALAHAEDSRLHQLLRTTNLEVWYIVPLQAVWGKLPAAIAERAWWDKYSRWAINDLPPAIPHENGKPCKKVPHRAVQVFRSLSVAKADRDFVRTAAVQKEAANIARELQIPLFMPAYVRVPYLNGEQKPAFARIITRMLRRVQCTSWERQALKSRIFLVRTVPHTTRSIFERHSNKCERIDVPPPCHCDEIHLGIWELGGTVTLHQGHFALLLVTLNYKEQVLRSKDPLPIRGADARTKAISECVALARMLNVPFPENWEVSLPQHLFPETGNMLNWAQHIAEQLSTVAIVRVVDKFPGALWGFCRNWMWQQLQQFLCKEKYQSHHTSPKQIIQGLTKLLTRRTWSVSRDARMALLYLIGKGKSLCLPAITWRPICAVSRPVIPRHRLRLAARAFSCFLRVLTSEITGCFHHHHVHSVAAWYEWLGTWSCDYIGEADCKDPFNNVDPKLVVQYLRDSTAWLKTQRKWRATQMCWSIHKTDKTMDRAGKATDFNFSVITHEDLIQLIEFSLCRDNFCLAAGQVWQRLFAIPMGGSFSAQSADLYCIWAFHLHKARSRQWDVLSTSSGGYPIWRTATGRLMALAQFRDNIIVASRGPRAADAMREVCGTLSTVWKLPVLCPCMDKPTDRCKSMCMTGELRALGICMHRANGQGSCVAHPSAFTANWSLKLGPPLQSSWAVQDSALANLYTSVLVNCLPFVRSWGGLLLSCAAWINMGLLCGHSTTVTLRAAHRALTRVVARTPYAIGPSRRCIAFLMPSLPSTKQHIAGLVCTWLSRCAHWDNYRYASFHVSHPGGHHDWCADWNTDWVVLQSIANLPPSGGRGGGGLLLSTS